VPNGQRININNDINNNYSSNNINRINFSDNILICPYCYTKNLFERDADELICYKCSRKIKSENSNETHEILTERESLDKKIIGWKLVPNPQFVEHPLTPIPQNSNNTEYLLHKILKSIKKQNSLKESNPIPTPMYNPYIPYPVFDYRRSINISSDYDDRYVGGRTREIRYVPIRTEPEKRSAPENGQTRENSVKIMLMHSFYTAVCAGVKQTPVCREKLPLRISRAQSPAGCPAWRVI
jgi:hypothetical protein